MARRSVRSTVVRIILLFLLVSFLVLCAYSVVRAFFTDEVLDAFRLRYGLLSAVDLFIENLIAIQAAAVILTYSLFSRMSVPSSEWGSRRPFHGIVSPTMVMLLVLTGAYTLLFLTALPLVKRGIYEQRFLSRSARTFLAQAEVERERGRYESAVRYLELYLTIDRDNRAVVRNRDELENMMVDRQSEAEAEREAEESRNAGSEPAPEDQGYSLAELLDLAQGYLESEDFFSAYYYATLALRLDEGNTEARLLKTEAWKELTSYELTRTEDEGAQLFERKLRGSQALEQGDVVDGYYIFEELSRSYPADPEVERLLEESLRRVREISFFVDEVERTRALPGVRGITFLNRNTPPETELIHLDRMVTARNGEVYFYGVEVLRMAADGEVRLHLLAPYGKLIEDHINVRCLERDEREGSYLPRILEGSMGEMEHMLPLEQQIRSLPYYSSDRGALSRLGINGLWLIREPFERAGYTSARVESTLLMRLLNPFLFLVVSLFGVSVGWTYRIRSLGRPPVLSFLLIPALPFLTAPVVLLLVYAHRIVLGSALLLSGLPMALTVLIVTQAALLVAALSLLAGQATE